MMKKKVLKTTLLLIVLLLALLLGKTIYEGNHGKGALAFLAYLQDPGAITETVYPVQQKAFELSQDGETIRGNLFLPECSQAVRKVIVFSHGFNCPSDLLSRKAASLASSGIAVITFDFRGGSAKGLSDGDTTKMTYLSERSDLECVLEYAKGLDGVEEVYLMGESFGGMVSALTAAKHSEINGLILCFPAFSSPDSARNGFSSKEEVPETVDVGNMKTGRDFWTTLYDLDVYSEIAGYTGRVLILHGTEDQNVPYQYSLKANSVYENSTLVLIEGAGHGFGSADAKTSLKSIQAFVTSDEK